MRTLAVKHLLFAFGVLVLSALQFSCNGPTLGSQPKDKYPDIFPDYTHVVIPYNISPLNFHINEPGDDYFVKISGSRGEPISIQGSKPSIRIAERRWRRLLLANRGDTLRVEIAVRNGSGSKGWTTYKPFRISVSTDRIDGYLAYRLINNGYVLWRRMGIYQRHLESYRERPIIENSSVDNSCINCHSFAANSPERMSIHIRQSHKGTVIVEGDEARKIETKTDFTMSAAVYPNWHPSGTHIAFSTNRISQKFTSEDGKRRQVVDGASDVAVYDVERNMVTTSPLMATRWRENLPVWSASGDALYYIAAPEASNDSMLIYARYSLLRVGYCTQTNLWGTPDTLINAQREGFSVTFPRASPDGRFLLFTVTGYGYFSIYFDDSDLYLMDLETMAYRRLEINSPRTDSYHSWSANGRWFVFSSKRLDGNYTRPYFAHVDTLGNVSKPVLLPQRDPLFYKSFLLNYNVPQLVDGRVRVSARELRDVITGESQEVKFDPSVDVDALTGATRISPSIYE